MHIKRICPLNRVFELESSITRLAKFEKCEFTGVNDHFENEHNAVIGLYRQTLKRISTLFVVLFCISAAAVSQPERIGAGLTFATKKRFNGGDTGNPGINVKTWIPVDKEKVFHIVPSVSAFMPLEVNHTSYLTTTYMFQGDLDFQARVVREKSLKLVAFAGINYRYIVSRNRIVLSLPDEPVDSTLKGFGPAIGAALEMRMSANWDFIVSARYSFAGLRPGDASAEEPFLVAPLASPVIQVHAVYYFYSRGRVYSYR